MTAAARIPIPWRHRWRRFRYSTLPLLCFLVSVWGVVRLWNWQTQWAHAVGAVEIVRVDVAAPADGVLTAPAQGQWTLFDMVEARQVVARLDDGPVRAQLATRQQELQKLRQEAEAAAAKLALDESDRQRDFAAAVERVRYDVERRRLDVLDRRLLVERDRLEVQRYEARVELIRTLAARNMVPELQLIDERALREVTARQLEDNRAALAESEKQLQAATERLQAFPKVPAAQADRILAPLAAAVSVQEAAIAELRTQIEQLTVTAPIRGAICAIHRWPGESLRAGDPIVTIAPEHGRYIVAYVRQDERVRPTVGMTVEVRLRIPAGLPLPTIIERVGPQVELIPQHQCRDPKVPEWGLPVRIAMPADLDARPGALLDINFKPALQKDS